MATEIKYNGEVIASPEAGQTATLKCAGMKMESDVVVEVAEQSGGGGDECNHETYDFTSGISQVLLKTKIEKPTEAQQAMFVDGDIAFISQDAEVVWSALCFEYKDVEFISGLPVKPLYVRSRVTAFYNESANFFYIWEDDVEILKTALLSSGVDLSGFSEGWYTLGGELGLTPCSEEMLLVDFWNSLHYVLPYGDYLYSIFEFYCGNDKKPASLVNISFDGSSMLSLHTQDKLCETDVVIPFDTYEYCAYDDDGIELDIPRIETCRNIGRVKIDYVGLDNDYAFEPSIIQRCWSDTGAKQTNTLFLREYNFISMRNTYGIEITNWAGDIKLKDVLTNATVVSKTDDKVFISQIMDNTHIVLVF